MIVLTALLVKGMVHFFTSNMITKQSKNKTIWLLRSYL